MDEAQKQRGPKKRMTEWIRLVASPEEKRMLTMIHQHYNPDEDYNESATVRRLIRREAARVNAGQPAQAS